MGLPSISGVGTGELQPLQGTNWRIDECRLSELDKFILRPRRIRILRIAANTLICMRKGRKSQLELANGQKSSRFRLILLGTLQCRITVKETWLEEKFGTYSVNVGTRLAVSKGCLPPFQPNRPSIRSLPMLLRNARLGLLAIIALVFLRFMVGFHFYMEGTAKVREGGFSSTGFLSSAKGPFAKSFQSMLPDFDGEIRLDTGKVRDKPDSKDDYKSGALKQAYDGFVAEASQVFRFTEEQASEAKKIVEDSRKLLVENYKTYASEIEEYKSGMPRVASLETDEMRTNVTSMRKQRDDIETKWRALAKPALADIDRITADFERRINELATEEQSTNDKKKIYVSFKLPSNSPIDVKLIDKILPIFDMSVGILLMLGLLTPIAAFAAGLFLASVVLTQFPGSHGSAPTYYQAIEMLACFFLAFSDAGRYAGLDFLPWSFWNRKRQRKKV